MTLQDLEDDSLQFDLSAGTLEELFKWYQAAWDITQRMISKEYNRQHEVSASWLHSAKRSNSLRLKGSRTTSESGWSRWTSANGK